MLLQVKGEYACFTSALSKVERCSYDFITPSAAKGVLRSIYASPTFDYRINRIYVQSVVRHIGIMQNERSSKINSRQFQNKELEKQMCFPIDRNTNFTQRNTFYLKNPSYVLDVDIIMRPEFRTPEEYGKVIGIFTRRVRKHQCYSEPYLGMQPCWATVEFFNGEYVCPPSLNGVEDYNYMLYSPGYPDEHGKPTNATFYHAVMNNGVVDVNNPESEVDR